VSSWHIAKRRLTRRPAAVSGSRSDKKAGRANRFYVAEPHDTCGSATRTTSVGRASRACAPNSEGLSLRGTLR